MKGLVAALSIPTCADTSAATVTTKIFSILQGVFGSVDEILRRDVIREAGIYDSSCQPDGSAKRPLSAVTTLDTKAIGTKSSTLTSI